jgi:hypothetical protein
VVKELENRVTIDPAGKVVVLGTIGQEGDTPTLPNTPVKRAHISSAVPFPSWSVEGSVVLA